ncbi:MAG: S4 domain-containing protein [Oscillospiraceae bacterium]
MAASKGEARRLVVQGGISVDGDKIDDAAATIALDKLKNGAIIKKGKKIYHKVSIL